MTVLGLIAGLLTTLSFLPQVVRTFRTGSAHAFSWAWLALFGTGVTGWLVYGVLNTDLPVIASNATMLVFVAALVAMRARTVAPLSVDGVA